MPDQDKNLLQNIMPQEVRAAVDRLPQTQAAMVRGHYLGGRSLAALAVDVGITRAEAANAKRKAARPWERTSGCKRS